MECFTNLSTVKDVVEWLASKGFSDEVCERFEQGRRNKGAIAPHFLLIFKKLK